jgi:hypothetical protein
VPCRGKSGKPYHLEEGEELYEYIYKSKSNALRVRA